MWRKIGVFQHFLQHIQKKEQLMQQRKLGVRENADRTITHYQYAYALFVQLTEIHRIPQFSQQKWLDFYGTCTFHL